MFSSWYTWQILASVSGLVTDALRPKGNALFVDQRAEEVRRRTAAG